MYISHYIIIIINGFVFNEIVHDLKSLCESHLYLIHCNTVPIFIATHNVRHFFNISIQKQVPLQLNWKKIYLK